MVKEQTNQIFKIYYDEAGRGPLAGPMYIGLICPLCNLSDEDMKGFRDSKKISEDARESLFKKIEILQDNQKLIYSPARVSAAEIDKYGMTNSLHYAILRGMIHIFSKLFPDIITLNVNNSNPLNNKICKKNMIKYSDILSVFSVLNSKGIKIKLILDGNSNYGLKKTFSFREFETIIHGDDTIKEISMASIVAKVSRDRLMESLPKKYGKYNFGKHKGYGTAEHKELIKKLGPSDIHRKLFLKWIYPDHNFDKKLASQF